MRSCRVYFAFILFVYTQWLLTSCANVAQTPSVHVHKDAHWAIMPFENHTTTPMAGESIQAITRGIWMANGYKIIDVAPIQTSNAENPTIYSKEISIKDKLSQAVRNKIQYMVTGSVTEWKYKVGLDGEPAVGLTLEIWDVTNKKIIFSHVSSQTGTYHQSLSALSQTLINKALKSITKHA